MVTTNHHENTANNTDSDDSPVDESALHARRSMDGSFSSALTTRDDEDGLSLSGSSAAGGNNITLVVASAEAGPSASIPQIREMSDPALLFNSTELPDFEDEDYDHEDCKKIADQLHNHVDSLIEACKDQQSQLKDMHKSYTGYVKKAEAHMKSQQKKLISNNQDAAKTSLELAQLKNRVKEQDQKMKKMDAELEGKRSARNELAEKEIVMLKSNETWQKNTIKDQEKMMKTMAANHKDL